MQASAKSKYIRISPYKLRPYVDVVRGLSLDKACSWLKTCANKRVEPILKTLLSAYANAKNKNAEIDSLDTMIIQEIKVDQGPIIKYFKPGAMGRASEQRKRLCHITVTVAKK